jgi:glucose-6-phosphate isomerase|tara:strand:+ start:3209 stop:4426 length:1218 start_codon:yes stop_codon:yes gene_type:complete
VTKKLLLTKNFIPKKFLDKILIKKLSEKFQKIIINIFNEVIEEKKVLNILNDQFKFNFKTEDLKKFKKFKTIVIIGMGGSILGAEAIHNFLKKKIKKKLYFFDDLDTEKILEFKKNNQFKKVLFLIISKSGNTIETLSNLFSLKIIKKKTKNIILIAEKNNNPLVELSKKFNLFYIEHKNYIGGRYSVFSEAGIIPALLMGLNITKFRSNITMFLKNKEKLFLKDSSIKLACLLDSNKINTLVFLNYSPELNKFLYWCQQLIAESLGKKGKGFLPMISNVPKDHHSLLQLYLDGPKNKLFHIFSIEKKIKQKINVKKYTDKKNFLHNKTIEKIKNAQRKSLIKAFNKNQIPFREFKIKQIDEVVLGELFSYFILETVIVGKLININPFDQPAVEQVKTFTKKMLS